MTEVISREVEARRAELAAVKRGLDFFLELSRGDGILTPADYPRVLEACAAIGPWLHAVRVAVNSSSYPREAIVVTCDRDHVPHTAAMHARHAPTVP